MVGISVSHKLCPVFVNHARSHDCMLNKGRLLYLIVKSLVSCAYRLLTAERAKFRARPSTCRFCELDAEFSHTCSTSPCRTFGGSFFCLALQRTSVSSVRHSCPYPEVLEVLDDIHTRTRNFWMFCTSVDTIPGVRVQHVLYPFGTPVSSVRLCHNTLSSVSSARLPHPYPEVL